MKRCMLRVVFKPSLAAVVYHLWGESNGRIIKLKYSGIEGVIVRIETDIRSCIPSWNNSKKADNNKWA